MKVAIVGSGISGITCAHYLAKAGIDTHLFEANDYFGGHTATVDVEANGRQYAIDTGFIVFNNRTYPNFLRLLKSWGIEKQETEMSFSVKNEYTGLEYNGNSINKLFAQRKNLVSAEFLRLVYEIVKFNRIGRERLANGQISAQLTLEQLIREHNFKQAFVENYLLPMGAAIWSSSLENMLSFPADFFLSFFENHGLLNVSNRPQWYVIPGGSREYVKKFIDQYTGQAHLNTPIHKVTRLADGKGVQLSFGDHRPDETFDRVIMATHSDQALKLIDDPTSEEQQVLGDIEYRDNEVILHHDTDLLPRSKRAWASWNYNLYDKNHDQATVTYNMNILQSIKADTTFCVTLNSRPMINPDKILGQYRYAHPQFNRASIGAQKQRKLVSGRNQTHFCGAYWYNGFHEDGVRSALDVCQELGVATDD